MALRDISESTSNVHDFTGSSLQSAIDDYLKNISQDKYKPNRADKLGVISFKEDALIDAPPEEKLELDTRAMRDPGNGTDAAAAIQLALASLHKDAMHRLLLIWDGNATAGDLNNALSAATAQHVPIDVMPLKYNVTNEVMMDHFTAPMWKRENEPFTMDVYLNSTNSVPVTGKLTVRHGSEMLDLDPNTPGMQTTRLVTLKPGLNVEPIFVPALGTTGVHQFVANFEGDNVTIKDVKTGAEKVVASDTLLQNNSASTFTFVRGKGKVLYIANVPPEQGKILRDALTREGISLDEGRTTVDQFPSSIVELQNYDAVILANVPRAGRVIRRPAEDAGNVRPRHGRRARDDWRRREFRSRWVGRKQAGRSSARQHGHPGAAAGAQGRLVMAIHSCEMPSGNYWGEQCALEAAKTLSSRDEVGVISYAWTGPNGGGSQWDFPLQEKGDGSKARCICESHATWRYAGL